LKNSIKWTKSYHHKILRIQLLLLKSYTVLTNVVNLDEQNFKVLSLYLQARNRIRICIKVKGRIRIRIKVTSRVQIRIKVDVYPQHCRKFVKLPSTFMRNEAKLKNEFFNNTRVLIIKKRQNRLKFLIVRAAV
jgi:hypothetical protein